MKTNHAINLSRLKITTKLLAEEALRKGYELELLYGSPSEGSCTIRCRKGGKEFHFKSLNTALTPSYGFLIAEDKVQANALLESAQIPIPDTAVVSSLENMDEVNRAQEMIKKYGQVVVKPAKTNHGTGVRVGVDDKDELLRAIKYAKRESERPGEVADVLVQKMILGDEYRFLVLENKVLAVATRKPPFVVGDGLSTIAQLVEQKNKDSRRGEGHTAELTKISIEDVRATNKAGFLEMIPKIGEEVSVLKTSNLSRGGEAIDVTNVASAELKKMAVSAARVCGLGIAGVDIMTQDIKGGEGVVIEVNVSPGIRMHQFPSKGKPRDVVKKLFRAIEKTAHPIGKTHKTIGRVENVKLPELLNGSFKARIDTGATMTSLWVSDIYTDEHGLHCKVFGRKHPLYSGKVITFPEYSMRTVRSSTGVEESRFQVATQIVVNGRKVRARMTLADRSSQLYPMLVGRNVLRNRFIVNVAEGDPDVIKEREWRHVQGGNLQK